MKKNNIICVLTIVFLIAAGGFLVNEKLENKLIGYGFSFVGGVCVAYLCNEIKILNDTIDWLKRNE